MRNFTTKSRVIFATAFIAIGLLAGAHWQGVPESAASGVALLVPDDLPKNSPYIRIWQDTAREEGVLLTPVRISEWVRATSLLGQRWEGLILPDTFHRRLDSSVVESLQRYVAGGGHFMLVYDGGLLSPQGFYTPGQSRFSDLAGVDYGRHDGIDKELVKHSSIALGHAGDMESLHIPPGRFASKTLTFPSRETAVNDGPKESPALIFAYNAVPQSFATLPTQGLPTQTLMTSEEGGVLVSRQRFGNGETLFVNFPLTYLKQRTDGVFLHAFLRYFARDMLGQPSLSSAPDGKGGIVMNWHIDAKPALAPLKKLKETGIFDEGPFSFHFTAGPDVNLPGDGGGLDVPANPEVRSLIKGLMAQGHAIGDHGGWIHNYFGKHIDETNQATFEHYLTLNEQAISEVSGRPSREYSSPVGNQPHWVTRWLEKQGFAAYYLTGNVGMGPTRAWLDNERISSMWAFPVLTLGPVATAEDAFFQNVPAAKLENWLIEVARFVERDQVLRLVYFHPPGGVLYLNAVSRFVGAVKACREAGRCQWITMEQAADFLNRRERVQWQLDVQPAGLQLVASDAKNLASMAWLAPKRRFARPVVTRGLATVDEHNENWRITAGTGRQLEVALNHRQPGP